MIIKYIRNIEILRDKKEDAKYIVEQFDYDNIKYSIYFIRYKHLFNVNSNYLKIRIISLLVKEIIN